MATNVQRATALLEALRNGTIDTVILNRIADYFITVRLSEIVAAGLDPANLTADQKARVILDYYKQISKHHVKRAKEYDIVLAAQAEMNTALADFDEAP